MSSLFCPVKIRSMTVKNRFMSSATYEAMAEPDGTVTDAILSRYRQLAKGDVGLIVPGHMCVHPSGKAGLKQTGIFSDKHIKGLKGLVDVIHRNNSKVVFQLAHAGRQTRVQITGRETISPSNIGPDPIFKTEPREMTAAEIEELVTEFGNGARRAAEAGADGVQVHAAHGYMVNQFLSPFFNRRSDKWGGSDENRFRFIKEAILAIKANVPSDMVVMVKLSSNDYTPGTGIDPTLAARYSRWLVDLGVDGIEISSGTLSFSPSATTRSKDKRGRFTYHDAYHLEAAEIVKPVMGQVPLMLVGGVRKLSLMEEIVESGKADMVSLSRPFIREPDFVKRLASGKINKASCISCNNCLSAVRTNLPVRCYIKGLPEK
ncbi:NADH:flavin oxidoreductase [Desulforhopalus singaporensis]|uniref:2,4-dienoyl-CoA reductase n=1 Tax=Desulforhopalus singaporensis TaxID=91360 RepID=A0A1H0IVR7_9BACT|nr:NADH:flavin oxidoreductase [Desulforhopalus singaporensis]SDO35402.1 2,4-dienoyl-CoA reductase [Desulforhopalus singaporensis]